MKSVRAAFDLSGKVAVITGGAGLLGRKHAEAVAEMGGAPILWDTNSRKAQLAGREVSKAYGVEARGLRCDITDPEEIDRALCETLESFHHVDILINNASNNPKVEGGGAGPHWSRIEDFPLSVWEDDLSVGLTGAFLCSRIIGSHMASRGSGVILNVASDLALIAPDQRIYRKNELPEDLQPVKPVSYSVVKAGLIGLTRYLATYWADKGVRVNAISPGGVYVDQDAQFLQQISRLIPLARMAEEDEYKAAIVFLVSDASSYMTGSNLVVDGGRTCW